MITVDTHVIIWDALEPKKLSPKAREAIEISNQTDGIIFCEISLWEIAKLIQKRRLEIDISFIELIDLVTYSNNYIFRGITPEIADLSVNFPAEINLDPADRLIAATAVITKTDLITADSNLRNSTLIKTIW